MTSALEGGEWQQHAPAVLYSRERPSTHCIGGCVGPRAGLDGGKSRPIGIRSPNCPARSQSLYRLSYPTHPITVVLKRKWRQRFNPLIRSPAAVLGHKDLDPYRKVSSHKLHASCSHFSASQGGQVSSRVGLAPSDTTTRSQSFVNLYRLSSAYFPFRLFKYWRPEKTVLMNLFFTLTNINLQIFLT